MSNPEVRLVHDWDNTQFDVKKYKADIFGRVESASGLDATRIREIYEATKDHDGFNDAAMSDAIADITGIAAQDILTALRGGFDRADGFYMFPDAREFDNATQEAGYHSSLLTAGHGDTQLRKITGSGYLNHFDPITVVPNEGAPEAKVSALAEMYDETGKPIIFFEDKIATIMHAHETFHNNPNIWPILINHELADTDTSIITWNRFSIASLEKILPLLGKSKPAVIGMRKTQNGHHVPVIDTAD